MRLSKTTSHALRVLLQCAAADGELVKVPAIASELGISEDNAFKIAHLLSRAGLIDAYRGRYGGIKLARPADSIRVGDIVRSLEVTDVSAASNNGANVEEGPKPRLREVFDEALDAFIAVLDQHTLADFKIAADVPARRRSKVKTQVNRTRAGVRR